MSAIGPGDYVEALSDWPEGIVKGQIYQVRNIEELSAGYACVECGDEAPGVHLVETPTFWDTGGWCSACDLKPIYRPKPDAFSDLLKIPEHA